MEKRCRGERENMEKQELVAVSEKEGKGGNRAKGRQKEEEASGRSSNVFKQSF